MSLQTGTVVAGKYRIQRLLGEGGMGAVYVAENVVLQKRVALKVLHDEVRRNPTAAERFLREAVSASQIQHPAIVQVFDAGDHDGMPWIAMELLRGESLRDRLERTRRLPADEAATIIKRTLSGLASVHEVGIVHRDLKPDNIFLEQTAEGVRVKILDFGIAKQGVETSNLTGTGTILGSAFYLAPEQARDASRVDHRTDIYAVGAMLYECLSGKPPFSASNLAELVAKILMEEPPPLQQRAPDVPEVLAALVHTCLSREPAARPQSARALVARLDELQVGEEVIQSIPEHMYAETAPQGGPDLPSTGGQPLAGNLTPLTPAYAAAGSQGATTPRQQVPLAATMHTPATAGSGPISPAAVPVMTGSGALGPTSSEGPNRRRAAVVGMFFAGSLIALFLLAAVGVGGWYFLGSGSSATDELAVRDSSPSPYQHNVGQGPNVTTGPHVVQPSTQGPIFRWLGVTAPLFADVNGDGRADVIGAMHRVGFSIEEGAVINELPLVALDGGSGEVLWEMEPILDIAELGEAWFAVDEELIVLSDSDGNLYGRKLSDGSALWTQATDDRVEKMCAGPSGEVVVVLADERGERRSASTGEVTGAASGACEPIHSQMPSMLDFSSPVVVADGPAQIEARVREATEVEGRAAYEIEGGLVIFGVASPGTEIPQLEVVRHGRRWSSDIPAGNRLSSAEGPPGAAAFGEDAVYVLYETRSDASRLTAFDLSSGERRFDVEVPGSGSNGTVSLRRGFAVVSVSGALSAVTPDGQIAWRIVPPS